MHTQRIVCLLALLASCFCGVKVARAQAFGVELRNTLMPASGAMGGVSIARPQDVQSTLGGNPATLTQYKGTHFGFGGAWVEPTISLDNNATLPNITPFEDKSSRPGSALGNIVATQDYSALGMPVTTGVGLLTASGLGIDYRDNVASNGTSAEFVALAIGAGVGVQVTDRLSVGMELILTSSTLDGPFTGATSAVPAYALRGAVGVTYDVGWETTLGFYWHTKAHFQYDDAIRFGGAGNTFQDIHLELPEIFGWGIANESLMCGNLLLGLDILYFKWEDADFFGAIWEDQTVIQVGAQYTFRDRIAFRLGYAYAENATANITTNTIGGINPQAGVNYIQALFPNINQHRFSAGVGMRDVLPGIDFDLFAGGMFENSQASGQTSVSVESYWIGTGITWRYGRGACECGPWL